MSTMTIKSHQPLPSDACASVFQSNSLVEFPSHVDARPVASSNPSAECVESLIELLQEVYQDHLLYDLFQTQHSQADASSLEMICARVSNALEKYGPFVRQARIG